MHGPASPDIRNYTIGKGIASFKKSGETTFRDLGNCPSFEFTPSATTLDHFSARAGLKKKDRSVVTATEGELKISMEEFTVDNLAMALLGNVGVDSSGHPEIDILQVAEVAGEIKFVMTNDIGQKFTWHFLNVSFTPSSTVSPISDEWGNFEVTGQTLAVNGKFGTLSHIGGEGYTLGSSS